MEQMHIPRYPISFGNAPVVPAHHETAPMLDDVLEESRDSGTSTRMDLDSGTVFDSTAYKRVKVIMIFNIVTLCILVVASITQLIFFYYQSSVLFGRSISFIFICSCFISILRKKDQTMLIVAATALGLLVATIIHSAFVLGTQYKSNGLGFLLLTGATILVELTQLIASTAYILSLRAYLNHVHLQSMVGWQRPTPVFHENSPTDSDAPQISVELPEQHRTGFIPHVVLTHQPPIGEMVIAEPSPILSPSSPRTIFKNQLNLLKDMGFTDENLNIEKLLKYNGNLQDVVNEHLSKLTSK